MIDKLGQEINLGDFVVVLTKGSGWDKSTYFSLDVVTRLTEKSVFYNHPEKKKRTSPDNIIVLTEEQARCYARKDRDADAATAKLDELYDYQEKSRA